MRYARHCLLLGTGLLALTGCLGDDDDDRARNERPDFLAGEIHHTRYDGVSNDLLTGGLGASGLASATAPTFADPANPTAAELRTLALYNNYRALVDTADGGGYGTFFGPHVSADGTPTGDEGLIPGDEYLAYMRGDEGGHVTGMVQIPERFDPDSPCMVTAPSSGSRGIYGAIGTAGEWGLKHGCAVVYTDKGTGTGSHDLAGNTVQLIDGRLANADTAGDDAQFRADLSAAEREAFNAANPDRFAFKHAHSQRNPEADWGQHVLQSIRFGFYVLNERFGEVDDDGDRLRTIKPKDTVVIASSVSNGGGASVLAAEQDNDALIDGVAVSEPNVNPMVDDSFAIQQGDDAPITEHSRSLYDYTTALAVYQGCANLAPGVRETAPFNDTFNDFTVDENICNTLAAKGLVTGTTTEAQAADAQRILNERFGIQPEQNLIAPSHFGLNVAQSISVTYANAYGRFSVTDGLCDVSMGATSDGMPTPLSDQAEAALFATSNGIPPTGGVNLIYDDASGGPTNLPVAVSPSSGVMDYGLDALLCLRGLATGSNPVTDMPLPEDLANASERIDEGIEGVRASGDLDGTPAVFVTGRNDAILPINHTSRPYFGLNRRVEGGDSGLHYYEILNAHHLDALNGLPGFASRYVPLHHYYFQALDLMFAHLRDGTSLPPSQVVRTTPRGEEAPPLTEANVPPIAADPAAGDRIVFADDLVQIPQ
ncbi:3-hydroxybutyrate oligomer hydrolase family protein [Arhodomonas sp. AD133]|uniref:3-hydroxybutyrate oligomer hydrolase family protein n=1 Tax=Arhodomonas sp. AD133 TaxID=3415009 RepID=UPI003EBA9E5C